MSNFLNNMVFLYCPFPSQKEAETAAAQLLSEKLVGCCNILGTGKSMYLWNGKIEEDAEVYVLFKTSKDLAETAAMRLEKLHPYEVPAVIRLEASANQDFKRWLSEVIKE